MQADLKRLYDWDWTGAEDSVKRALELDPGSTGCPSHLCTMLLPRSDVSRSHCPDRERRAATHSPAHQSSYGRILYRARRFDAILRLNRAVELDARNYGTYGRLGDVYEQMGRYTEAVAFLEKARALTADPGSSYIDRLARVYARMGRRSEARQMLEGLKSRGSLPLMGAAGPYTALGDKDEAFKLLFRMVEERGRGQFGGFAKVDPPLDSLHSDPRWQKLLRRMNLPADGINKQSIPATCQSKVPPGTQRTPRPVP